MSKGNSRQVEGKKDLEGKGAELKLLNHQNKSKGKAPERRKVEIMRKLNEYTRKYIEVQKIETIFRNSDNLPYSIYKDSYNKYYIDAYDGAASIAELNANFANDEEAIEWAQEFLDDEE